MLGVPRGGEKVLKSLATTSRTSRDSTRARTRLAVAAHAGGALRAGGLAGLAVGALFAALSAGVATHSVRLAFAVALVPIVIALVWTNRQLVLLGIAAWLSVLGLVRRLVPAGSGVGVTDFLLLIGPLVLTLLCLAAFQHGALRKRSALSMCVALLSIVVVLEAFNPRQGSLLVGIGGVMYVLVPMLAFWIGRSHAEDGALDRILWFVAGSSVVAAAYGLFQQYAGFPSWDRRWIETKGYAALNVNGVIRAFGFSSSAQEYALYLGVGLVILILKLRRREPWKLVLHVAAIALVAFALILESSRSPIVTTIVALGLVYGLSRRWPILLSLLAGGATLGVFIGVIALVGPIGQTNTAATTSAGRSTGVLINHQLRGLEHPFSSATSTLGIHVSETASGLRRAWADPLGFGAGSVTLANRLNNTATAAATVSLGTEDDIGNAGTAFGLLGLLLYGATLLLGLWTAYEVARREGREGREGRVGRGGRNLALISFAVPVVLLFQWLNGDLYSVAWLAWLALGWADARRSTDLPRHHESLVPVHSEA